MDDLVIKESVEWCCKNVYISTGISRSVSTRRGTLHILNEDLVSVWNTTMYGRRYSVEYTNSSL